MQTLVLGLGNELLRDEGVGVHAARQLLKEGVPGNSRVVMVGTAIIDALPELERADRLIVLDAMKSGGQPGTVYRIPMEHCSGASCIASMHGFDIFRAMALTGRTGSLPATVFGVEPLEIRWSMDLSARVSACLPHLLIAVQRELAGFASPQRSCAL
jgi:hydrogenase maturation protease